MWVLEFLLVFIAVRRISVEADTADLGEGWDNEEAINEYPIIGVVAHELHDPLVFSYIAASYVKFIEGGGARVVPIWINKPRSYYKHIMKKINGVLFPGGDADFTSNVGYAQVGRYVYELASDMNANGEYFPLWGTCLGFELLIHLSNNDTELRTPCSAQSLAQTVHFLRNDSRLLSQAQSDILGIFATHRVAANFHHYCVTPEKFAEFGLQNVWSTLATNKDRDGLEFISVVEHKKYPFYAVQFHPEKNLYEWHKSSTILHSKEAIKTSQYFAQFLVDEARKSKNLFKTVAEANRFLIYNWPAVFVGRNESSPFDQVYYFSKGEGRSYISKLMRKTHNL